MLPKSMVGNKHLCLPSSRWWSQGSYIIPACLIMDRPWHRFRASDGKLSVDDNRLLIVVTHNIVLVGFKHKVVSPETPCVVAEVTHIHSHCPRTQKLVCLLRRYKRQMVLVHITGLAICLHVDPRVAVVVTRCDRPYMAFELAFNSNLVVGQNLSSARARNLLDAMVVDGGVVFDSLIKLAASFTDAWWCWSSVMLVPWCQLRWLEGGAIAYKTGVGGSSCNPCTSLLSSDSSARNLSNSSSATRMLSSVRRRYSATCFLIGPVGIPVLAAENH